MRGPRPHRRRGSPHRCTRRAALVAALAIAVATAVGTVRDTADGWCQLVLGQDPVARADYVFSGTVVWATAVFDLRPGVPCDAVRVAVHTVFKGELPPLVDVGNSVVLSESQVAWMATSARESALYATRVASGGPTPGLVSDLARCAGSLDYRFRIGGHYLILARRTPDGYLVTNACSGNREWPEEPEAVRREGEIRDLLGVGHAPDPAAAWATLIPRPTATPTASPTVWVSPTPSTTSTPIPHPPSVAVVRRRIHLTAEAAAARTRTADAAHRAAGTSPPRTSAAEAATGFTSTATPRTGGVTPTPTPARGAHATASRALPPAPGVAALADASTGVVVLAIVGLAMVTLVAARRR